MSQFDNMSMQIRARLQAQKIKLWEEPYYMEGIGCIDSELDRLAEEYSLALNIEQSRCRCVLVELQDHSLRKLAARREYNETGVATFKVRRIDRRGSTTNMLDVKCDLNELGATLNAAIAVELKLSNACHVKCISAGRLVSPDATLAAQGLKNNQQLIVIVGQGDDQSGVLYDRINKIKADVETVVASENQLMEMEDQDGNPVFLPQNEYRALLMGMGYCEKARAAIHREHYDEALLLLLEADEKFSNCNSKFLETVDNYALLNLDIVWCYLCLKNVSQLPDAERRLNICERSFRRSYGENYARLYALKGKTCPERALILRLNLLQGVVLFHQNRRDEAYERFESASAALIELKVNDDQLMLMVDMGFDVSEARLALRSCSGNVDRAVEFIQERKQKLKEARSESKAEREIHRRFAREATNEDDANWVNPRSVCTLTEMGFEEQLAVEALRRTENDVPRALDLLQTCTSDLRAALATRSEEPSTSLAAGSAALIDTVMQKAKAEIESLTAYKRFNADLTHSDQDYLDLPLVQEEQLLAEYRNLLEQ